MSLEFIKNNFTNALKLKNSEIKTYRIWPGSIIQSEKFIVDEQSYTISNQDR